MTGVGFEPTPPKRLVPKTSALDHSATLPYGKGKNNAYINKTLISLEARIAWPSGLRRWFKAPVTSVAWVRIPPLSTF